MAAGFFEESEDGLSIAFKGQEDDWKQYGYKGHTPHIYGYALAWTWAGVIEFNKALYDAIAEATEKLKTYFPNETPQIIIRGQQR